MATGGRLVISVTDDMHEALKRQAAARGASLSGIVRFVLAQWLEQQGESVEWIIEMGGRRERAEPSEDDVPGA